MFFSLTTSLAFSFNSLGGVNLLGAFLVVLLSEASGSSSASLIK